jgi:hypothetical protein
MHPDAIIDALKRELGRLDKDAPDHEDRKAAIHEEIARVDGLERPSTAPEKPDTVVDQTVSYLAGLRFEISRAEADRKPEIEAEIARVEADLGDRGGEEPDEVPETEESDVNDENDLSPEEIEARRQARAEQGVEQARSAPVPGEPVPAETPSPQEPQNV